MQALPPNVRPKLSTRARLQTDRVTGKPILLYPEGVLVLNATGHAIVSLCDGAATLEEITKVLTARYREASADQISRDVVSYLNELRKRNLLELVRSPGEEGA